MRPQSSSNIAVPETAAQGLRRDLVSQLLGQLVEKDGVSTQPGSGEPSVSDLVDVWFRAELVRLNHDRKALRAALDRQIAAIDDLLSAQVNAILHAPSFQRLEAAWRGLFSVAEAASETRDAKVRMLCVTWSEIVRDLERAADFDQSQLFHKLYNEEFDMPGGEPFGLLVADYAVQHRATQDHPTDDVTALKSLSAVAAAAFTPIILGVSPSVLQLDSFRELGRPIDVLAVFKNAEYQRWNSMRQGEDMRFIGLALPRMLMRLPYDGHARPDGFCFREVVHEASGAGYLWGNAAFAFAGVVLRAFRNFGWLADIRGTYRDELRGGLVTDLPVPSFRTDRRGIALRPSTESYISEVHEKALAELGFVALRKVPLTEFSAFNECQSLHNPRFDRPAATMNARLSGMLQYVLCVSRFAHFLKVIGRDAVGSVKTAEECEELLQRWLTGYCEGSDNASSEVKARYPLREGRVEVKEVPGKPGHYACNIFLRPHFQLDDVAAGFRLVTELAPAVPG
jgi:type VI secretion system protein ImpD